MLLLFLGALAATTVSSYPIAAVGNFLLTYSQVNRLTAADGSGGDMFGHALAMSGDFLVVGAHRAAVSGRLEQGTVYIYEKSAATPHLWLFRKKITAADGHARDHFGVAVDIDGETIIVGAYQADLIYGNPLATDHGAAYIYRRNQGGSNNWGLVKKIAASDFETGANFGWSVALRGPTAVVGAYQDNSEGDKDRGAAYIFSQNEGGPDNWGQIKKLTASDGQPGDYFGYSVALDGQTAVVGGPQADISPFSDLGAVYVFEENHGGSAQWSEIAKLTAADGLQRDLFGSDVTIEGNTIAVGAYWADHMFNNDQGAVYLFDRHEGGTQNWGVVQKIQITAGSAQDHFGKALKLSDGSLIISAPGAQDPASNGQGIVYQFIKTNSKWNIVDTLSPANEPVTVDFGSDIAHSGPILFIGADGSGAGADPGQALLFSNIPNTLTNRLYLPLASRP